MCVLSLQARGSVERKIEFTRAPDETRTDVLRRYGNHQVRAVIARRRIFPARTAVTIRKTILTYFSG